MDEDKSKRTDLDIASEIDRLFDGIPEPSSDEEVRAYLEEIGYDAEKLKAEGAVFVKNLISSNWRFADLREIHEATSRINEIPMRKEWDRGKLIAAIEKLSSALSSGETQLSFAFRNLDELTDTDLATILQELEYKARNSDITLDLDS